MYMYMYMYMYIYIYIYIYIYARSAEIAAGANHFVFEQLRAVGGGRGPAPDKPTLNP